MTEAQVLEILRGGFEIATKIAGPLLMAALVIGVVISILQTITQVQEMTLTFVPKVVAAGLILLVFGSWMIQEMTTWVETLWSMIPSIT
jgi:flagellar biosynthetic protein FliQ